MTRTGQMRLLASGILLAAAAIPATFIASEASLAATVSSEIVSPESAQLPFDSSALLASDDAVVTTDTASADLAADEIDADLECMAKVVVHEAGNQPRAGQLAIAQLIVNRVESGRFAETACAVVNQPGQFFRTATYNPRRDTAVWATAVEVSREALAGQTADVAPGAMFFRAAYSAPSSFFRSRTRVVTLGDHVFYR